MRIIDISRPLLQAPVYPGDPSPHLQPLTLIEAQDEFNTSALYACLHNGTHLDAPLHAIPDGDDISALSADCFTGECTVVAFDGVLTGEQAEQILENIGNPDKLLFKGDTQISPSAAFVFADAGLHLIGVEATTVGFAPYDGQVHRTLLQGGVLILEGLDLSAAQPGRYFLVAAPLSIQGAEASPVRALLICRNEIDWDENTWKR